MSVVIRLMRAGGKKRPFYRVVAADSRRQRDGRFLEILGHYSPLSDPLDLKLKAEQVHKWLAQGAQPSEQVRSLFKKAGLELPGRAVGQKPAATGAAEKPAKKPAKRRVVRKVSERKAKKRAARKAGKGKPAARKTKKAKAEK
jgi:small subunit ribosomal protein S16